MNFILFVTLLMHPVHETVAEVEWNAQTNRLEVALRLDPLDEQWLVGPEKKSATNEQLALKYLTKHFRVSDRKTFDDGEQSNSNADQRRNPYHWVGRKADGAFVWWYFEIEPRAKQRPSWIRHRMFFERDERYTNRVIVLGTSSRRAVTLTADKPIARLDDIENESSEPAVAKEPKS